jgi:chorismate synthase
MPGNSFGQLFRITTFGESHGGAVGVVIDGCPPGIPISHQEIQSQLDRRKPGQSDITSPRSEQDIIHILSGISDGMTTGTPILLIAHNKDVRSEDYAELREVYRPGHADYTYQQKYGIRDWRGSGRASARETLARVAAGAVAQKYLQMKLNITCLSYVEQVGNIKTDIDMNTVTAESIESNIVRCPDPVIAEQMIQLIQNVRDEGDSVGGIIRGVIRNVPAGLGEPVFDKISADLAKAMISINAVKGFDIGSGFHGTKLRGSQHNDKWSVDEHKHVTTASNYAGGVLGGITNGENIYFRVAFKPVSTIKKEQDVLNTSLQSVKLQASGRHDPCVLPRAVPIVDAMSSLVIIDHYMRHKAQNL